MPDDDEIDQQWRLAHTDQDALKEAILDRDLQRALDECNAVYNHLRAIEDLQEEGENVG